VQLSNSSLNDRSSGARKAKTFSAISRDDASTPRRCLLPISVRPALVLSPAAFNDAFGLAYVAPITTKPRGHAFEIPLAANSRAKGVVMVHELKSLDWRARHARVTGKVSAPIVAAAVEIVKDICEGE